MIEDLQALDSIRLNFNSEGLLVLNIVLAIIMFGIALDIKPSRFSKLIQNPKPVIIGLTSQFLLLPAFTFLLCLLISDYITIGIALGMIMVASCPGGNISNFISNLSKGNTELSVSLTGASTLGAIFLTPLNFTVYGNMFLQVANTHSELVRPISIDPFQMFQTVFLILGLPLILGFQFSKMLPGITERIKKPIKIFSILAFIGFVVIAFSNNFNYFIKHFYWITIIVFFHNVLALAIGYYFARISKIEQINWRTISIETGIQNSGLALVLIFNPKIFPLDLNVGGMMFIAAWWGIWHIIAGLSIAALWRRKPVLTGV
jgi:BASS family bile acid:Na+ symporter